jgi:hypothetical protein
MDLHARYHAATPYERRILDESLANEQRILHGARQVQAAAAEHRRRQEAQRLEEFRQFQAQQEAAADLERRQLADHAERLKQYHKCLIGLPLHDPRIPDDMRRAVMRERAARWHRMQQEQTGAVVDALTGPARLRAANEQIRRAEIARNMAANLPRLQAIRHARSQVGGR